MTEIERYMVHEPENKKSVLGSWLKEKTMCKNKYVPMRKGGPAIW